MRWPQAYVGDLVRNGEAEIQTGPFGTQLKASDYTPEGTPVINVRNIGYRDIRDGSLEHIPDRIKTRLKQHILAREDIVFGRKGAVDRHAIISEEQVGWVQGSDCIRLRLTSDRLDPHFLSYSLLSETHKKWMVTQASNKATMASLNHDVISRIFFSIPPLPIQQEIIRVISQFGDLIENNRRRIALLEQAARFLYEEWFVRLRFPGHEYAKFINGLPVGWGSKKLSEKAVAVMGQSPPSKFYNEAGVGLPFHQGVKDYGDRFPVHRVYCSQVARLAEPGDILFSVRAPVGRINISRDRVVIGRGLAALRARDGRQTMLFHQLRAHFYKEDMIGTGAIYAAVTKGDLFGVKLVSPPDTLVSEFEEKASALDRQVDVLTAQNAKLADARDLLLPRLMSGEVEV